MNDLERVRSLVKHVKPNAMIQGGAYRIDRGPTPKEWRTFRLAVLLHEECKKAGVPTQMACIVNDFGLSPQDRPKTIASNDLGGIPLAEEGMRRRRMLERSLCAGYCIPELYYDVLLKECSSEGVKALSSTEKIVKAREFSISEELFRAVGESIAVLVGIQFGEMISSLVPLTFFSESALRNRASEDDVSSLRLNDNTGFLVPICASIMGRFYYELAKSGHPQQIGFYTQEPRPEGDNACALGPNKGARKRDSGYELKIEVINYWVHEDGCITAGGIFLPDAAAAST